MFTINFDLFWDRMFTIPGYMHDWSSGISTFLREHTLLYDAAGVSLLFLLVLVALAVTNMRRPMSMSERIKAMSRRDREDLVKQLLGDLITDAMEELHYTGTLSRYEVETWYKKLAHHLHLKDLLPLPSRNLKARIKYDRSRNANKPVALPDAVARAPRNRLEAILNL